MGINNQKDMTKEDNIIIPRSFLEVIEDTLRIQNNINLDKKTGETCQDRNVKQSLNIVRKLLRSQEITGMERLEKLQPSLPANVDEAAEEFADYNCKRWQEDGDIYYDHGKLIDAFKAGAKWMAGQGETIEGTLGYGPHLQRPIIMLEDVPKFYDGHSQEVIVQIRKK